MTTIVKRVVGKLRRQSAPITSGTHTCPVCGTANIAMVPLSVFYLEQMQKFGFIHNIFRFETLNISKFSCSVCGASDRDRLYALFLSRYFSKNQQIALQDIAPASALAKFIKGFANVSYRSMDLYMDGVDDHLDITDMHLYADGQFDFFVCSHVLEHIPDDAKAMAELHRILKVGGAGIVMVPIALDLDDVLEDPTCTDVATRWKLFGQDDHIRMYAKKGFVGRLEQAGFKVEMLGVDHFGADQFETAAVYPSSILYIVHKC